MTLAVSAVRVSPLSRRPRGLTNGLVAAFGVWKQRRALATLDTNRLADLGLTPRQAAAEAARPIWDMPK